MAQATILLVDDHLVVRQGCRRILEQREDVAVVGEAATGQEALEKIDALKPTIILLDLSLPDLGGIELIRLLKARHPKVHVIVLSVHTDEVYVYRALEARASAYIVKQGGARELEEAIDAVTAGHMYLSPLVSRPVVDTYLKHAARVAQPASERLTAKEQEVLGLLTEGLSSKEIGQRLKASPQTIDVHRRNIMKKLNIHTVPELVKWAIRNKFLTLDE
jgi:DNA-binding NarL/FixJ family response regulator